MGVFVLVVVVSGHVGIEGDLEIDDFRLVDVIFVDLFGNNVESYII